MTGAPGIPDVELGRILNPDEIDTLLQPEGPTAEDGLQRILNSGLVSFERLPMLEVVFDRLVRMMTTSLRNFTSDNVEVTIESITSLRFGEYINTISLPAMIAVFIVEQWKNYGLLVIDSTLTYSIVDVLLGGRRGTVPMRVEGRPHTTIERTLVERLVNVIISDLSASFDPLCKINVLFERLEINPRFAMISRYSNAAIVARLRIDMDDRGGRLELLLPYATLEPVRDILLQQFMGEKFGRDAMWESHLADEVWATEVGLEVVLDEQVLPLGDVLSLIPGMKIPFVSKPGAAVRLQCGDVPLFSGFLGRKKDRIAVRLDTSLISANRYPTSCAPAITDCR